MFTNLHRSHQLSKRVEKPVAGENRVAMIPANGCEDTEAPGF